MLAVTQGSHVGEGENYTINSYFTLRPVAGHNSPLCEPDPSPYFDRTTWSAVWAWALAIRAQQEIACCMVSVS